MSGSFTGSRMVDIKDDGIGNLIFDKIIAPDLSLINQSTGSFMTQSSNTSISSSENYVGNIFYNYGVVTITETGSYAGTWDLATAVAEKTGPSMTDQNNRPHGLFFKPDGTKYWMIGNTPNEEGIFEFSLSGSWDIGTAAYTGVSKSYADLGASTDSYQDVH